jgi:two-component system sensor histidine kinase RegB
MFGTPNAREAIAQLAILRWLAVGGQSVAILVGGYLLNFSIPVVILMFGPLALTLFNLTVQLRLRRYPGPVKPAEVLLNLAADVVVLSFLLALTGGPSNPFFSLHLVPVALAAVALPLRWVVGAAAVTLTGATAAVLIHLPLPSALAEIESAGYRFSVWTSFALCLVLLSVLLVQLAGRGRQQAELLQQMRERAIRNESVVALASQAASLAHELNTPLGTVANLVADLRREFDEDPELGEDLRLMQSQMALCRDYIREMVELSRADAVARPQPTVHLVDAAVKQFRLLHPEIDLVVGAPILDAGAVLMDRSVVHLLVGLMNNAADASRLSGARRVEFDWGPGGRGARFLVRDFGPGLSPAHRELAAAYGFSSKPLGLGLGLALGHMTAERFDGALSLREADGPGTIATLELPFVRHPIDDRTGHVLSRSLSV